MKQKLIFFLLITQSLCGNTFRFVYNKDSNTHVLLPSFLQQMQAAFDRSIFVETGTYNGETTQAAARIFSQVHSVEFSSDLYNRVRQRLQYYKNIHLYHDHSAFFLDKLCALLQPDARRMLFWLDAHYCGDGTACYQNMLTPIVEELRVCEKHAMGNAVIMVDDIRCFGSLYKNNHLFACPEFPSLPAVVDQLKTINPNYTCVLYGDTLIAYDESMYHPELSPVVRACTYSRLYDGHNDFSEKIIEEEACIAGAEPAEASLIDSLYQNVMLRRPHDFHAFLWYGLLVAKKQPKIAQDAFKAVLERGYTHWRIYWYLAQAAYATAEYEQALLYTQQVLESNPHYVSAVQLKKEIIEQNLSTLP